MRFKCSECGDVVESPYNIAGNNHDVTPSAKCSGQHALVLMEDAPPPAQAQTFSLSGAFSLRITCMRRMKTDKRPQMSFDMNERVYEPCGGILEGTPQELLNVKPQLYYCPKCKGELTNGTRSGGMGDRLSVAIRTLFDLASISGTMFKVELIRKEE